MRARLAAALSVALAACALQREPEPPVPSREAFAGSQRCAECHATNHARWSQDWHARALAKATADSVLGRWEDVHFEGASTEAWMTRSRTGFTVRTRDEKGELGDHAVSWVIGGRRMQDPLTSLPDGRWQVLPVYFHVTGGAWVDYNEARQGRVTPDHPFFWTNFRRTANHECLDCHVTGLEVTYGREKHAWDTRFTEAGVGCESCHGPGARHARTSQPEDIVHPRRLDPGLGLAICARCHGPRNPTFPLLDGRHRFQPGDSYDEFYDAYFITSGGEVSTDFFADGRPASGSFEYQALLESRCHRRGGATCLTCHTAPHRPHGPDELRQRPDDPVPAADQSCRGCHRALFDAAAEHARHRSREAQSCVACHMPRLVPAVLDLVADHSLDIPVPENTERHGVPNACNLCHATSTPRAMAVALHRLWPEAAARQARRLRLAEAFDSKRAPAAEALASVAGDPEETPGLRGAAAVLLARADPARAGRVLPPLLADGHPTVRARAAAGLGLCRAPDAAARLAPLLRDPSLRVRETALLTLAGLDPAHAEPAVRDLLADAGGAALPQVHLAMAYLAGRRGDFAAALAEAEQAVALKPYNVAALIVLADAHGRLGNWEAARSDLQEALRFDPRNPAVLGRLQRLARP